MKKRIRALVIFMAGVIFGICCIGSLLGKSLGMEMQQSDKMHSLFSLMFQWLKQKQQGKKISDYLKEKGYKTIAVYGMGNVGGMLCTELQDSDIRILYGIDKNKDGIITDIDILAPEDKLPDVDAVIVTPITLFDEIRDTIGKKTKADILSLKDIIEGI